ncbi:MAG: diaminopimelate epimerase [Bauldia sp.]
MKESVVGAPVTYRKMNGAGNEILVVDLRRVPQRLSAEDVRKIAAEPATHFDQLMALLPTRTAGVDARVRIFNRDGSIAGTCGNGARCIAAVVMDETGRADSVFETDAGLLHASRAGGGRITVDMGAPRFRWDEIPLAEPFPDTRAIELQVGPIDAPILHSPSVVSMGNPHAIFWVENVDAFDLERLGPLLENHPMFPERANISLAEVTGKDAIRLRVWERGAGITLACGSAACATAVAAARTGRTGRAVAVTLPGGTLDIVWRESDGHVLMTGPWELESTGELRLPAAAA